MSYIINIAAKTYERMSSRRYPDNWQGDGWIPIPPRLEPRARAYCPDCELVIEDGVLEDILPLPKVETPEELEAARDARQSENKAALAAWLDAHPLTWTDGQTYGVTENDQNEMALNLLQYQVALQMEQPAVLEWHAQKQNCRVFTPDEYSALSLEIARYVYPYRRYQEQVKTEIYTAGTVAEVNAVQIKYEEVTADGESI